MVRSRCERSEPLAGIGILLLPSFDTPVTVNKQTVLQSTLRMWSAVLASVLSDDRMSCFVESVFVFGSGSLQITESDDCAMQYTPHWFSSPAHQDAISNSLTSHELYAIDFTQHNNPIIIIVKTIIHWFITSWSNQNARLEVPSVYEIMLK